MTTVRTLMFVAIAACAGCGRGTPAAPPHPAVGSAAETTTVVKTQTVPSSPCAWLSQADAEKIAGSALLRAPRRVLSAENPQPSDAGEACLYEFPADGLERNTISIQLIPDESGAMQTAFAGMGDVEKEFKSAPHDAGADPAGHWDYIGAIPGGLTALRQGRIAVQMTTSSSVSDKGLALAAGMLDHIPDLPFVLSPEDAAVSAPAPDPCRLITRAEAESVLGHLIVAPYRSRKATALAFGGGGSCSYFSQQHRALVVTPKESHGAQLFGMLRGVDAKVARRLHTPKPTDVPAGDWDQMSIGVDGTLHALKGDKLLSVQFTTSSADLDATAKLISIALARL